MALFNCPECGKKVSDRAEACPHCGYPINEVANMSETSTKNKTLCPCCGGEVESTAPTCPECGHPLYNKESENKTKDNVETHPELPQKRDLSKPVMWVSIALAAIMTVIMPLVFDKNEDNSESYSKTSEESSSKTTYDKLSIVSSVEEAKSLIDGTTWHYTENTDISEIGFWIKVEFSNGSYKSYYAKPSDGTWTKGGEGQYQIEEGRFSNTGGKYIAVKWEGGDCYGLPADYTLVLNNCQLKVVSQMPPSTDAYYNMYHPNASGAGFMELGDYEW